MTFEKTLTEGKQLTTFYRAQLVDGRPVRVEVQHITESEQAGGYGAPPFVAIVADGVIPPTCGAGETAELAALEVIDQLNHRYRYAS